MKFEGTKELPSLDFNEEKGEIKIFGRSVDLYSNEKFWNPLIDRLSEYLKNARDINVSIELEFFSTRSAKSMLNMFKLIEKIVVKEHQKEFIVNWIYDDEELLEAGEDYQSMLPGAIFKFTEK